MSRANRTPRPDQTVQLKSSSGGSPASPDASGTGSGRGWVVPLVIVVLVVAAVFLIVVAKRAEPRNTNPEPAPAPPVEAVAPPVTNVPPEIPAVPEVATNAPSAVPAHKLQGVGYNAARPWAIVDGKTVYAGDRVGNYSVKEILQSAVTLEDTNGSLQTLFLHK
jgi:hypothetical protein